ncbi:DUF4895 domain-containing protein [Thermosipho ferrireducens]|uniref:DUF4895 domain-containing protein n=1 Tax=Thermosipho ferrireducens TaxID=2571116 RepID=A0ABX7S436_9BACT|nr:DUF4895 domain-containing protein [Thermosipho ferrireducens]QTA37162.1 DUF4895 domain-containing protein [Thermosipho ferrireducens]
MIYIGPDKLKRIKEIPELLSNKKELLIKFLFKHKEKLDAFHKHVILISVKSPPNFSMICGYNHEEKPFFGITFSDPFERTPSLYKMENFYNEDLGNFYNSIFNLSKLPHFQCGILKFPVQTHFIAIGGDETLIKKELFSEELTGKKWMSFAKNVTDDFYEDLVKYSNGKVGFLKTLLTDDGLYFVGINKEMEFASLYAEFFSLLRNKYKFLPGKFAQISSLKEQIIGVFKIELDEILNKKYDLSVRNFITDFEKFRKFVKNML